MEDAPERANGEYRRLPHPTSIAPRSHHEDEARAHSPDLAYQELVQRHAELRREVEQVREARDQALQNSRTRSEFLARLSDELANPLSALLDSSRLLLADGRTQDSRLLADLERVRGAGRCLLALMNRSVVCAGCGKRLRYRADMAGNRVRCVSCGHRFHLRPAPSPAAFPPSPDAPALRSGRLWPVHAGIAVGLLLGGLALGALVPWRTPNLPKASQPPAALLPAATAPKAADPAPDIVFKDDVRSNAQPAAEALDLAFVDSGGRSIDLRRYRGKKHVVLVINRGFAGAVCVTCSTATSRLIQNYEAFTRRDAEVLVVYPGPRARVQEFVEAARARANGASVPFPILLDEDSTAVKRLGIEADLAKPSIYILDKAGQVRFAYVGTAPTDRPSVKALLEQLDRLARE